MSDFAPARRHSAKNLRRAGSPDSQKATQEVTMMTRVRLTVTSGQGWQQ
jgi:hypothetical protein